jgi:phosphatidylinositol alpha-mannosyltransferase
VLVESMAAGLPVVASDIPGYDEVVRDGIDGLLVPARDAAALASAAARVLDDTELAGRLSLAGRQRSETFAWTTVAPRIEAIYERVTGASRSSR